MDTYLSGNTVPQAAAINKYINRYSNIFSYLNKFKHEQKKIYILIY